MVKYRYMPDGDEKLRMLETVVLDLCDRVKILELALLKSGLLTDEVRAELEAEAEDVGEEGDDVL